MATEYIPERFAILPIQFFPSQVDTPEKELIRALLEDLVVGLVKDVQHAHTNTQAYARLQEDLEFLDESTAYNRYPLSFARCCHALGLSPVWVREGILQRLEQVLSHTSPTIRRHKSTDYKQYAVNTARWRHH